MTVITNSEFLEAMFADTPDDAAAMVCGFAGDPKPAELSPEDRRRWAARPWMFGDRLRNLGPTTNNYVAVSSFYADPQRGSFHRRKANFARLHAVMIDDLGDGPGAKLPLRHIHRLPPSALIETSPRNFQAWLFLQPTDETDTRVLAETLIDAMIRQGLAANADPGMSGVTRYGRLPVGVNGKAKYLRDGQPFPVRLVQWNPERRYDVAQVVRTFGLNLEPPAPPAQVAHLPGAIEARQNVEDFAGMLDVLKLAGLYQQPLGEGRHAITCPWAHEHTAGDISGTAVMEPSETNRWCGGFRCHHGHGQELKVGHVYRFVRALARRGVA